MDKFEICGFCRGTGTVYGSMFDREGRQLYLDPPPVACDYCGGRGSCIDGDKLWPAPSRKTILRRQLGDSPREDDGQPE